MKMITQTSEKEWLDFLKNLPRLASLPSRTVILSPHPDDETLGAGGLISDLQRNNIPVTIIAVTNGENAYKDIQNLSHIRIQEQNRALKKLGVNNQNITRLNFVDSALELMEEKLFSVLYELIKDGDHLIAPWINDFHPDHTTVGRVATKLSKVKDIVLDYYFFWTWHHGTVSQLENLPLHIYPLNTEALRDKEAALNCYVSQLKHPSGNPILPENLLAPAKREFEVYCRYEQ